VYILWSHAHVCGDRRKKQASSAAGLNGVRKNCLESHQLPGAAERSCSQNAVMVGYRLLKWRIFSLRPWRPFFANFAVTSFSCWGSLGFSQLDVLVIIPSIKIITCMLQIPRGAGFLRERTLPTQQTRVRDKLFTVDIAKSGGKIAPIRIPLQQLWLHLPRIGLGQTGILSRREDEQS
jgi:hypothetical protein